MSERKKRKLYFGCALHEMSDEYVASMLELRKSLKTHFEVLEFRDDCECGAAYRHDIHHCVRECDLMLAMADKRSTGLGWELGVMVEALGRPVLACAKNGTEVTKFLTTCDMPCFEFVRYNSTDDILSILLDFEIRHFPQAETNSQLCLPVPA